MHEQDKIQEATSPIRIGCLLEDIDENLFHQIVDTYDEIYDGNGKNFHYSGGVKSLFDMFGFLGWGEYRFGSWLSSDSKLEFHRGFSLDQKAKGKTVTWIEFYANTPLSKDEEELVKKKNEVFDNRIIVLLQQKGIALELD